MTVVDIQEQRLLACVLAQAMVWPLPPGRHGAHRREGEARNQRWLCMIPYRPVKSERRDELMNNDQK